MTSLKKISEYLRLKVFDICLKAKDGHIGGNSGAVELLTTLYFGGYLRYNPQDPDDPSRDFVTLRGHLGPVRYAIFELLGWLKEHELDSYRKLGSRLPGHEDHFLTPGVDISPSGSLGMLLSYATGAVYALRRNNSDQKFFVFLGDGEEQEGSVSEAARSCAALELGNVVAIIDCNGAQLSDPVSSIDNVDLVSLWKSYGWNVISVADGHDIHQIGHAYGQACSNAKIRGKPTVIIARTVKGLGIKNCENHFSGYHTMSTLDHTLVAEALISEDLSLIRRDLDPYIRRLADGIGRSLTVEQVSYTGSEYPSIPVQSDTVDNPDHCQFSYFRQLKKALMSSDECTRLYFLTADTTRKDTVDALDLRSFSEYLNLGIREQHTVSFAFGVNFVEKDARIIFNTFDAFIYRSMDQINALTMGKGSLVILSENAGLTNSTNGKTHQTAYQPAAMLMHKRVTFLEPWNSEDTFACLNWALRQKDRGCVYIRVGRFNVSESANRVVPSEPSNYWVYETDLAEEVVFVASGLCVDSCIGAARILHDRGIGVSVLNIVVQGDYPRSLLNRLDKKTVIVTYNGNPDIIRFPLSAGLLDSGARPNSIHSFGFDEGSTGSLGDLVQQYGLDKKSLAMKVAEIKK